MIHEAVDIPACESFEIDNTTLGLLKAEQWYLYLICGLGLQEIVCDQIILLVYGDVALRNFICGGYGCHG